MPDFITDRRKEDVELLDRLYQVPYQEWDEEYKGIWSGDLQPYYAKDGWYDAADGMYLVAGDGNVRGAYNEQDLNRVQDAVEELAETFHEKHGLMIELEALPTWTKSDIPDSARMGKFIRNAKKIRDAMAPDNVIPTTMANLNYVGANRLEQMLIDADKRINRIEKAWRYCGEELCGA